MKTRITIFTLCLTLFLVGSMSAQETVWVAAAPSGAANGTSEADAYGSLATALFDINSDGDVLRVVGTVPAGSQNLTAKNFVYTIEGDAGGSTLTGISGAVRMFTINGSSLGQNVTFKNIIFSGSTDSTGAGGGVFFSNNSVTIKFENCRFEGNSTSNVAGGGALHFTNSTVTINDCLFKGNIAPQMGGAIAIYNTCTVTMTGCTFVQNKTTNTGNVGGGALYITGAATTVTVTHCTFFENSVGHSNQDHGTIRSDNGNTTINNSLFYNNKVTNTLVSPPVLAGPSDWGAAALGTQTFNKSLGQWITSNIDFKSNFISFVKGGLDPLAAANLTSSNLTYNDALGKVTYTAPTTPGENSPIDFVSAGVDAGAWQFGTSPTATPTFTQVDAICSGGSLSALPTTSNNAITGTWSPALNNSATTTYTFTPSDGQSAVTVTMTIAVNTTSAPASESQTFCGSGTIANLVATGTAIQWYSDATGGTALSSDAALASGTYYVTQNINGCESYRTGVAVTVTAPLTTSAIRMVGATPAIPSVTIGTQTWTAKNLDVATYSDGTVIPQVQDATEWANLTTGAWCYYNNDPANGAIYGKLYNWYAVAGIYDEASKTDASQRKKLAPIGYHVPSDAEWTTLTTYLGGEDVAGFKMKATGISLWQSPNQDATNESGFTGLPGGCRNYLETFYVIGNGGFWWSSSAEYDTSNNAWYHYLSYGNGNASIYSDYKKYGFSVRCLKD